MSGVYSVEDLLKLRASPLICKPPNLPPIEEWMGSQEPPSKRPTTRGRQDDGGHLQTEGFQKRPTLDSSLRKSTTDPERIVLGPPRRSFASSSARNAGKTGATDFDDNLKDSSSRHERTKTGEELEHKFTDRRSGQFGGTNGRFHGRFDQDHDRPRRRHEDEDADGRSRREHDRSRWGREDKPGEEMDENGNIRLGFKRDPQARSRFEQSWLRNDRGTEEARKENDRSGWRRDRVKDGDWDTPAKGDADPEWMDTLDTAEPVQAHTQEDFQRWKERMKAAANGPIEEKQEVLAATVTPAESLKSSQGASLTGLASPDLNVDSMDKFFAKFTEKRTMTEEKKPTTKPAAKSKFASLFSPPVDAKQESFSTPAMPVISTMPTPPMPAPTLNPHSPRVVAELPGSNTEADQAGFKRILEMLGKRDITPVSETHKPKPNPETSAQERNQSPDLVALFKQSKSSRQTPVPPGFERPPGSHSPAEGHRRQQTPNKDELLLNLLRQADISAKPTQQHQRDFSEQRLPPGLFASMTEPLRSDSRQVYEERQELDRQGPVQQRSSGRHVFDDPAIVGSAYQDEQGSRQGPQRRPTNGFEDQYFERLRQQESKSMQLPPGMPRPPGLEQMSRMPPGWPAQPPAQHQQSRQGPPPGINMTRGMQPPFGAAQQGSMPQLPQQGQRPQRKYTGENPPPNFPPGIGPPPGFVNSNLPPGFHNTSSQGQGYGRYTMGADIQAPPQQGPPNVSRAFMDMFPNVERSGNGLRGGSGGVPLPPGFR